MREFGYPLEGIKLPVSEKIKFYFWIFPSHLIRMLGWTALSLVFRNKPRVPENRFYEKEITNVSQEA